MSIEEEQARFHRLFGQISPYMTIAGEVKVTSIAGQVAGLFFADGHELKRGQRLMLMAVELDDNETPKATPEPVCSTSLVGEGPSQGAARILIEHWLETEVLRDPQVAASIGTDAEYQAWCRQQRCVVCNQIDYAEMGPCKGMVAGNEYAHVRRAGEAGTGYKPLFAGVPLCHYCHRHQHQKGELDVLLERSCRQPDLGIDGHKAQNAKVWFHMKRFECLERWILETWPAVLGYECWAKTPIMRVVEFCRKNNFAGILPDLVLLGKGEKIHD